MDSTGVDSLWLLLASFLVLLMQAGFLLLEGGRVRAKNSINVAQKNVSDLMVAWVTFFLFGFAIMYSIPMPMSGEDHPSPLHFLFQLGFCATAASIVSGGVAERMRFIPYLILAAVMGGFLFPFVGRLTWGDTFVSSPVTWLSDIGFVDYAGGTVVHALGGWAALVAIIMIGPRTDRFDANGQVKPMPSGNSIMSLQGALLLCFGWIGFNAGGISVTDPLLAEVVTNTFSTAAFGAAGGAIVGALIDKGVFNPARTVNGMLGGLVTSTASIHVMHPYEAMIFGCFGGAIATACGQYLLVRFKLDDPVDVVATHAVAGVFGTLLFAFVAPVDMLVGQSRVTQFGIQLLGSVSVFALVAAVVYTTLFIVGRFTPIRVTADEELIGLNFSEHGESIGTDRLNKALYEKIASNDDFSAPIQIEKGDEHNDTAAMINTLINQQEQARNAIAASERKFQQFANTASDWLWETDNKLSLSVLDIVTEDLRGVDQDQWRGKKLHEFVDFESKNAAAIQQCWQRQSAFGPIEGSIKISDIDHVHVEIRGTPNIDSNGHFVGYRGTVSDITSRKAAESRAVYLSNHDELTNLRNRRALNEDLVRIIENAKTNISKVAFVGIDLDGFKAVNDSYGHDAGDNLLVAVSRRLEQNSDQSCHVYRTGGDEFVLLIENLTPTELKNKVSAITDQTLQSLKNDFPLPEKDIQISASIGVAIFPDDAFQPDELARRADLAMYSAKFQGKSRVAWFDRQLDNEMDHRFKLETELKRAIENDEFYFLYQPLVDTQSEKLEAFEALIRWKHPDKGELSPDEFIGIIEKHDLMSVLGEHILDKVCAFASTWNSDSEQPLPRVAINISPSHLASENFTEVVLSSLKRHALPGNRLELEITEEAIIVDHHKAVTVIEDLRATGINFSIDDFGTGQTSLRYLSTFPVHKMKIDRSFVSKMGESDRATEVMKSMVDMGAKLGYSVVAEGVENVNQLEMLKTWNCPVVQGFLFSKPVASDVVLDMLEQDQNSTTMKKTG